MNIRKFTKEEIQDLLKPKNLLPFNRKITKAHAMGILDSIDTYGVLRLPVMVKQKYNDDRYAIADGQHTLTGLVTTMKKNSYQDCIIVECKNKKQVIDLIAKLNTTAKSWTNEDFLNAWLNFGADNEHYSKYELINNRQQQSGISLSKILDIFAQSGDSFKKGNVKLVKNIQEAELIYNLCFHFRVNYKTAAHAMAGVIQFGKSAGFDMKEEVNEIISRADRRVGVKPFPKDREDLKNELEKIHKMTNSEFNNYIAEIK